MPAHMLEHHNNEYSLQLLRSIRFQTTLFVKNMISDITDERVDNVENALKQCAEYEAYTVKFGSTSSQSKGFIISKEVEG